MGASPFDVLLATYVAAARDRNIADMVGLYHDDALLYDMWGEWQKRGIAEVQAMVSAWFGGVAAGETVVVTFSEVETATSGDLATATGYVAFSATDEGGKQLRAMDTRFTFIARQHGGEWKITHQHFSAPVNPQSMTMLFNREMPGQ
jgi:uncharacterized protein (TIGR02246 family)